MLKIRKFVQRIIQSSVYGTIFLLTCTACDLNEVSKPAIDYVDPLLQVPIGRKTTALPSYKSQTIPAIGTPFGMAHWTLETRTKSDSCGLPFQHEDPTIQGFRFTHISTQYCSREYGSMTLMMKTGQIQKAPPKRSSTFSIEREQSSPGYLGVNLTDYGIFAEVTASAHAGFLQFHFPQRDTAFLFVNTHNFQEKAQINFYPHSGEIWVRDSIPPLYPNWPASGAINAHYLIQIRKTISDYGIWEGTLIQPNATELRGSGERNGFYLEIPVDSGEIVQVKVGTSYWNNTAARLSLNTEIPHGDFKQIKGTTEKTWKELLERFSLNAHPATQARFYQSLYYASIMPRIFSGTDGLYPAFSENPFPFKIDSGDFYGDLSIWNNLRDPHPQFLTFAYPERMKDIETSLELLQKQADSVSIFPEVNQATSGSSLANLVSEDMFKILGLVPNKEVAGSFKIQAPSIEGWTLKLDKGNSFQVVVENFQEGRKEIERITLNGKVLDKQEISLAEIHAGGKLEIVL